MNTTPELIRMYEELTKLADLPNMDVLWQRTVDWQRIEKISNETRGGGSGEAASEDVIADRIGDATASRYHDEVAHLVKALHDSAARLARIHQIVMPGQPRRLQGKDMLVTQVAADGWCVSCWRHDQTLVPIALRTSGPDKGKAYYRDRCRFCGGWKAEHGQDPNMDTLERHHDGRRIVKRTA